MAISLKRLMTLEQQAEPEKSPSAIVAPASAPTKPGTELNVGLDFTNFERTIASFTENAKNQFQQKLMNLVGNKQVFLRGSKGYGQPIKDYTINVKNISIDFYYDRYVVVFKDEDDKEYFLEPGYKIKILGPAQIIPKTRKKKKLPFDMTPVSPAAKTPTGIPQAQIKNPQQNS